MDIFREFKKEWKTNMYGAAPYLMQVFHLSKKEASDILTDWMANYNPDDYKEQDNE